MGNSHYPQTYQVPMPILSKTKQNKNWVIKSLSPHKGRAEFEPRFVCLQAALKLCPLRPATQASPGSLVTPRCTVSGPTLDLVSLILPCNRTPDGSKGSRRGSVLHPLGQPPLSGGNVYAGHYGSEISGARQRASGIQEKEAGVQAGMVREMYPMKVEPIENSSDSNPLALKQFYQTIPLVWPSHYLHTQKLLRSPYTGPTMFSWSSTFYLWCGECLYREAVLGCEDSSGNRREPGSRPCWYRGHPGSSLRSYFEVGVQRSHSLLHSCVPLKAIL